jgi:hypothetical protein
MRPECVAISQLQGPYMAGARGFVPVESFLECPAIGLLQQMMRPFVQLGGGSREGLLCGGLRSIRGSIKGWSLEEPRDLTRCSVAETSCG